MHHAYIYEGSLSLADELMHNASKRFGFAKAGDPDARLLMYEKFGIEESRELKETSALKSVSGHALYVVAVGSMTTEAQQALLKLFEEPPAGTTFVLLAPKGTLIATLRSRFLPYVQTSKTAPMARSNLAIGFLAMSHKARSAEVAKLLKDDEGVRERVREFLDSLEVVLYAEVRPPHNTTKGFAQVCRGLEDIAKVRSYFGDRSPSFKMLLEHLALSLPQI